MQESLFGDYAFSPEKDRGTHRAGQHQAGLTTQLPSALIYLLYGLYGDRLSSDFMNIPDDLPDNIML